jgi:hypothetical protein
VYRSSPPSWTVVKYATKDDFYDILYYKGAYEYLSTHRIIITAVDDLFVHDLRTKWNYTGFIIECERKGSSQSSNRSMESIEILRGECDLFWSAEITEDVTEDAVYEALVAHRERLSTDNV